MDYEVLTWDDPVHVLRLRITHDDPSVPPEIVKFEEAMAIDEWQRLWAIINNS